ncbi:MAG TPA: DUF2779 domain-containing protein, partial [Thermoanaerobaculia bacterium]|nr:DUF2779 domain-containing protein [Thermoanaerobaculia bacterium]
RLRPEVEFRLAELQEVAERSGVPVVQIGEQCGKPHDCPLKPICWDFLPDYPVTDLYRNKKLGFELLEQGILRLEDIPAGIQLNGKHHIQRTAAIDGEPQIDRGEVRRFLSEFEYPLQYLDFETVAPAIPLYQGTRPYQQVPFQFSLHIEGSPGAEVEHRGFLAEGREDPRPEFLRSLQDALLDEGSIVVYNAGFEKGILRGLAESFPEGTDWVERLEPRIVDLLIPFRNMWYYHPDQNGSASIKAVLPVLTDLAYDDLDIAEGGTASREFLRITFDDIDPTERARVRKNLEIYCALDTEAMVRIVRELEKMAGGAA